MLRQAAVSELINDGASLLCLRNVVACFLDTEQLLSICIQVPKQGTLKFAENKITNIIHLKHTLELVQPLQNALQDCENELFKAYHTVCCK